MILTISVNQKICSWWSCFLPWAIFVEAVTNIIHTIFGCNWPSGFREDQMVNVYNDDDNGKKSHFSAASISWREQNNFQWDDDEVCFVLNQHAELDFHSASSLKQQSRIDMSLHSDTLFWFRANQSLLLLLNAVWLAEKQKIPIW
jgi:hypothetical protein